MAADQLLYFLDITRIYEFIYFNTKPPATNISRELMSFFAKKIDKLITGHFERNLKRNNN